jgi:hypothetical protein
MFSSMLVRMSRMLMHSDISAKDTAGMSTWAGPPRPMGGSQPRVTEKT